MIPSTKQFLFAKDISEYLGVALPEEYTSKAYSEFISKYIDVYKIQTMNSFALEHGYF